MVPIGLGAVVPNRVLVLDHNLENIRGLPFRDGLEPAEEGSASQSGVGDARLPKGGLRDRVVLGEEVPFDHVANLGDDILWVEDEGAAAACDHAVGYACVGHGAGGEVGVAGGGCGGGGGQGQEGGEDGEDGFCGTHFDGNIIVEDGLDGWV